jgi:hypothetical protein
LEFVVEETLGGRGESLKEYVLGKRSVFLADETGHHEVCSGCGDPLT